MKNYSFHQKILHDVVLSNYLIGKALFYSETFFFKRNLDIRNDQHVFISGMPRSGTTILLNFLYKSNKFASLTYQDMPFIMSPNLWGKFYKKKKITYKERLHGDGIKYSLNSPEAFEEVFWNTFQNDKVLTNFNEYIHLVMLKYKKDRYLSKNNGNYKRLNELAKFFKNSKFLIPMRDPFQTAYSLFLQHRKFKLIQKKEKFIKTYMNYLGHYEFGLNHKPWFIPKKYNDSNLINYWLEQWFLYHQYIFRNCKNQRNIIFIEYEKLVFPKYQNKICKLLKIENIEVVKFFTSRRKLIPEIDLGLYDQCKKLRKKILSSFT